jgi:squalene monooxygenase
MTAPDVVIVGGGFVGMAAAASLADGRRRVVVLEARAGKDPRFRGELIHPRGAAALAELGLLAPLAKEGSAPVEGFAVVPGAGCPAVVLPYDDIEGRARARPLADHHAMVACLRAEVLAE